MSAERATTVYSAQRSVTEIPFRDAVTRWLSAHSDIASTLVTPTYLLADDFIMNIPKFSLNRF